MTQEQTFVIEQSRNVRHESLNVYDASDAAAVDQNDAVVVAGSMLIPLDVVWIVRLYFQEQIYDGQPQQW